MGGNPDWNLIFGALAVIIPLCGLLYKVWRDRKKDIERKREIYKALLEDINSLIECVKKKELKWLYKFETFERKVSPHLYRKLKLLQERFDSYYKLFHHNRDFIRFKNYFHLNSNFPELQKEFRKLGVGKLEYELYNSIVTPILDGEKITLRWLEDKEPKFYEHLTKCPSYKELKGLLDWLNEENPCIVFFKEDRTRFATVS